MAQLFFALCILLVFLERTKLLNGIWVRGQRLTVEL